MSHFNVTGTIMFLVAFGGSYGVFAAQGRASDEGAIMMLAGPLLAAMDLIYRRAKRGKLLRGPIGGTFIYVPVWIWGVFWTGLGAYYMARSRGVV